MLADHREAPVQGRVVLPYDATWPRTGLAAVPRPQPTGKGVVRPRSSTRRALAAELDPLARPPICRPCEPARCAMRCKTVLFLASVLGGCAQLTQGPSLA